MSKDINDKAVAGELPDDPGAGATTVSADVPRVQTVREVVHNAQCRALDHTRVNAACVTGHYQIDYITGGFKPGFVTVFGADTSWGKSSFLVMVADENIKLGKRVMIVSAEDSEEIYGDRLLLRRSRVSANRLRERNLEPEERTKVTNVVANAEDVPVFLDARGRSAEWLAKQVRQLIREYSIDLVAYDYLQAFDSDKRHQDRRNQVSYIARVMTDSVKLEGVSGMIFSQITIEKGKTHPDKHSIRESRDVSNAAEVVMLGFTPEKPIVSKGDGGVLVQPGQRCILVDKCKNGPKGGLFAMDWDSHSACFTSTIDPEVKRMQSIIGDLGEYGDNR